MSQVDSRFDESETVGGPIVKLDFRGWTLAPKFAYLTDTPVNESESSDTISREGASLERHELTHENAKFVNASFASLDEFKKGLTANELLYFHVFEGKPDRFVLESLAPLGEGERVLLLDVRNDAGFLRDTPLTIEITTPPRQFLSKPLAAFRGLGAWAKGQLIGIAEGESEIGSLISRARLFARRSA